mgnify:FL=1
MKKNQAGHRAGRCGSPVRHNAGRLRRQHRKHGIHRDRDRQQCLYRCRER